MRPVDWAGCAIVGAGVAVFVISSPASSGRSDAPASHWLLAFGAVALVSAAAAVAAVLGRHGMRAAVLAVAAGVTFGMTAAVTLSLTRIVRFGDGTSILAHWQPWALLALGGTGLLLSASAYKSGALRASLPIMDTVEPVSAVLIGTVVFGERLATSPAMLALQAVAATSAATGIVLLAWSPLVAAAQPISRPASVRQGSEDSSPSFSETRSRV